MLEKAKKKKKLFAITTSLQIPLHIRTDQEPGNAMLSVLFTTSVDTDHFFYNTLNVVAAQPLKMVN